MLVELEAAPLSCFVVSLEGAALEELELAPPLGAGALLDGLAELDEDEDGEDGVVLAPAPAEPLMLEEPDCAGAELDEPEGALDEDEDEPPLAWSFLLMSIEVDEELEPEGAALGELPDADEDEEPGAGVVAVPPADEDDDEPEGGVVAPEGDVVEDELEERSAPRSHAAISDAPSARETATAMVESLMWPPWLGYGS